MSYPISRDALDDRLAIIGTPGSGKTYMATGAMEHILAARHRVVAIDPLGVMWGLRLCADGKTESPFRPVIFGGNHADLPLTESAGEIIGEACAIASESCIVDLSDLPTDAAERRFMSAFLDALYRKTESAEPYHLIIDEADRFAPQKPQKGAELLLHRTEEIVRRGRVKGFIPWLITQRPAVLNKNVLSMVDGLVLLKLMSSHDRDQLGDWIDTHADKDAWKRIRAELPTLDRGRGLIWIPGREIEQFASFPPKATFDSSASPKRGHKRSDVKTKPLDVERLREALATVEAEVKANDPRALKAEVARLKVLLSKSEKSDDPAALEAAHVVGYTKGFEDGYLAGAKEERAEWHVLVNKVEETTREVASRRTAPWPKPTQVPREQRLAAELQKTQAKTQSTGFRKPAAQVKPIPEKTNGSGALSAPQQRVLAAVGFWASVGNVEPTRPQVAAVSGYSASSGRFGNLVGSLITAGQLAIPSQGRVRLAIEHDGLSREEAADTMLSVLSAPQRIIFEEALRHQGPVSREDIALRTSYSAGSGRFGNLVGSLCTLDILRKPQAGMVEVSDWAREVVGGVSRR